KRHYHLRPATLAPHGDAITGRRALLVNNDVTIALCRPTQAMDYFYRPGDRDEVIFVRSEEHTSELQSRFDIVCRLLLEKKKLGLAGMGARADAKQGGDLVGAVARLGEGRPLGEARAEIGGRAVLRRGDAGLLPVARHRI